MAFGSAWGTKDWDSDTITPIISREIQKSWQAKGMGDFGVGLLPSSPTAATDNQWKVVEVDEKAELQEVQWIGYVGVRDATTTSMLNEPTSQPTTTPWLQMVELRYGFHPDAWGRGYGTEAAKAVMGWCVQTHGVQRFIAETEVNNAGSAKILQKLGFVEVDEAKEVIWGMDGTKEWERRIVDE